MENVSYIGLSRQMALHRLMEITANNMANINTPGYKSQNVLFREYLSKPQGADEKISQVQTIGAYRDLSQGSLTQTSNKLDMAIQGPGYFVVRTPDGVRYTRAGSFALNSKGEIVTKAGHTVLNDTGGVLTVPTGATQITVTENGDIGSEQGSVGKMKIATFGNLQSLIPAGDNLYDAQGALERPVEKLQVVQGMIETSNVQSILEMNKMIEILRMYQSAQNMLMQDHERLRSVIQRLTRV
jgi:flagellar basal-body rod protein FlgF